MQMAKRKLSSHSASPSRNEPSDYESSAPPATKKIRTENGESVSNGQHEATCQADQSPVKDPRLARRKARPQGEVAPQSPRQNVAEDTPLSAAAAQEAQRSMRNMSGLEAKIVVKRYQIYFLHKKLREKEECLTDTANYLKSYPAIKRAQERQVKELHDEIDGLEQTVQKAQADITKEQAKFDKSVADLIEECEGRDQALESYMNAKNAAERETRDVCEELAKRLKNLESKDSAKIVDELRTAMGGLSENVASMKSHLQDVTDKYQHFENNLRDADEGTVSAHERKLEAMEARLKTLESAALPDAPATASRTASIQQIINHPNAALEQGNVDAQIKAAVSPLRELLQAHDGKLARASQLELDLNRILAGLGIEHADHPNKSTFVQANGQRCSGTSSSHYAPIPQDKAGELEQRIQVLSSGLESLRTQHQQLTTTDMCKAIVAKVREMYPDIFPATKKEIENLRGLIQSTNSRLGEISVALDKLRVDHQNLALISNKATENGDQALKEIARVDLENKTTQEKMAGLERRLEWRPSWAAQRDFDSQP